MFANLLLAAQAKPVRGGLGMLEIALLCVFYAVLLFGIIWFVRYLIRSERDRRRLRLEVAKLADEVQRLRQGSEEKNEQTNNG